VTAHPAKRTALLSSVCELLADAVQAFRGTPQEQPLRDVLDRVDEPLRVAIAGKIKAGKSTLLNALVGEELAPTDEGECTRIVTWYRNGHTYQVMAEPTVGEPRQVPFNRDDGALEVELGSLRPEEIDRLVVDWPSRSLERLTLIDTPGIASVSADVSAKSYNFLTPDDDRTTEADAVLYLMKHLHATDVDFLEAFHDEEVSQATPVNAIAILSRADEIGSGRLDSMESAERVAARYRIDPKVRRLAQTVLPVAGLLAQTGTTLREAEFRALHDLAQTPATETDNLLLSTDRFINGRTSTVLTSSDRELLLNRFGLYGVRLALHLIESGEVSTSTQLAAEMISRSGMRALQTALLSQFADRRDTLKARSGLLAIEAAVRALPEVAPPGLVADLERISASAHELNELRLINLIRANAVTAKPADLIEMERILGTSGTSVADRLSLPAGPDAATVIQAAQATLAKWQRKAESPLSTQDATVAARIVVRTCEGILADAYRPID
jgi:predicted GTPase